jgi:hypothetical protein
VLTVEFNLTAEQSGKIIEPTWSGPLGRLARRKSAGLMERMAKGHAGPTKITVSDVGIQVTKADSEQQVEWSAVRSVNERTLAWVFLLAPSGTFLIPADAVPASQLPDWERQLRALAGTKYRVRDGGMRRA